MTETFQQQTPRISAVEAGNTGSDTPAYFRVNRQARWMRALRAKSGGMVEALMSSTCANSASAASSNLKRRKLLEKYSAPPGANRASAARSRRT